MFEHLSNLVSIMVEKPWAIFIILTLTFGYLYFEQNQELKELSTEVGGLRTEQIKMNEIIKLKVELVKAQCTR